MYIGYFCITLYISPILCYYVCVTWSSFDVVLCPSTSLILATPLPENKFFHTTAEHKWHFCISQKLPVSPFHALTRGWVTRRPSCTTRTCDHFTVGRLWLTWVVVLRPTRHKIGHFGDLSTSQSLGLVRKKLARIHQSKEMYYSTKQTQKTKARFSRLLWHPAWKWSGSVLNGKDKKGRRWVRKREEKWISGEVYNINKQTVYIASESKIESKAHYALRPLTPSDTWK